MFGASLRDIAVDDLEKIFVWRNKEHIRSVMFNQDVILWDQHIGWYNQLIDSQYKISKIFSVNHVDLGVLNINEIDRHSNKCSWGFYVGEKKAPKGTGLLLGYTSLEFIFNEIKIRKLCAEVIESNKISCNFHEKLGFKLEGILRKHIKRKATYENVYVYSLFVEEWEEKKKELKLELEGRFK